MNLKSTIGRALPFDTPATRATQGERFSTGMVTTPFVLSALRSKVYRSMNGVETTFSRMNSLLRLSLLWLLLASPDSAIAEKLGRLFFTPEQRVQLEHRSIPDSKPPASTPPATINGIVQKHGGGQTVWIDGAPRFTGKNDMHPAGSPFAITGQPLRGEIKTDE